MSLRWLLAEPKVEHPPARQWWDYALVVVLWFTTALELVLRDDIVLPAMSGPIVLAVATLLLWRRTHPLQCFLVAVAMFVFMDVVARLQGEPPVEIYSMVFILVMMYSLARWGSGSEVLIGVAAAVALWAITSFLDFTGFGDLVGGLIVMLIPFEAGGLIRYQKRSRLQAIDQAKTEERAQLARELHDTVAHRVSAIAIQAQVGRMLAKQNPSNGWNDKLNDALAMIEEEASRTLSEMRHMVGSLRDNEPDVEMRPQLGFGDIPALGADGVWPGIDVQVSIEDRLAVDAITGAALYRIAQESVTNAAKHADGATRVDVAISRQSDTVTLVVSDDGAATTQPATVRGFGLLGMAERAERLNGTFKAGPTTSGWQVTATLPYLSATPSVPAAEVAAS